MPTNDRNQTGVPARGRQDRITPDDQHRVEKQGTGEKNRNAKADMSGNKDPQKGSASRGLNTER
jgi:hypothetical protein